MGVTLTTNSGRAMAKPQNGHKARAMKPDIEIDAVGLLCPLPVLRLRKRLQALVPGQVARLLASDPMALIDVPHFCAAEGHDLLEAVDATPISFLVRKG
jgi:tRNA 2-thiouridine synthesizing protein A